MVSNAEWVVVVPFWAVWPYETMVLPKKYVQRFTDLNAEQKKGLADIIKQITTKYDNLFKVSFPYSMGWHGEQIRNMLESSDLNSITTTILKFLLHF